MQDPRQIIKKTVYRASAPSHPKDWSTVLERQVDLWQAFVNTHTSEECESAKYVTEVFKGQAVTHIWYGREETDVEYSKRIIKEDVNRKHLKERAFNQFHQYVMENPEQAKSHIFSLFGPDQVGI